jgi:hypothetical protein
VPGGRDPSEPIPETLKDVEADIDYWTNRLGEGQAGSDWEYWVEMRLKKLERARLRLASRPAAASTEDGLTGSLPQIDVFLSHSSLDIEMAKSLVALIRSALNIPSESIRCTSVDGHRPPGGASVDEMLRREIHGSKVLVGLITPNSMESAYVLFELGARWGGGKPMIPLLAAAASTQLLRGPLSVLNALSCDNRSQLHQFVEDLARIVGRTPDRPAAYESSITDVVELAVNAVSRGGAPPREVDSAESRVQQDVAANIPYMTAKEREIVAYLLAHKQKMFTSTPDGGHANTLISKGIVVNARRPDQVCTYHEIPFVIPEQVWSVLVDHRDEFPYVEPQSGESVPHPWRVHWMAR